MRVGHEGKPDDATDSETDDEKVPHVTLSVDSYYDEPNSIIKYGKWYLAVVLLSRHNISNYSSNIYCTLLDTVCVCTFTVIYQAVWPL